MDYTLYEYESLSYQDLHTSALVDAVEVLNHRHGQTLVEVKRHELRATQFVGMIYTPHGSLTVLPKIDQGLTGQGGAMHNLLTMLGYAYDLPLLNPTPADTDSGHGWWFELLTGLFCQRLYTEARQGLERAYFSIEERSTALKGRWLVGQQLTRTPHLRHAFEVRYDDFSPGTPLNQIFLYTITALERAAWSGENRRMLSDLRGMFGAVRLPTVITPDDLTRVHFTRLNERFRPAFQVARLFIESMTQVLRRGDVPLSAFVFDMNVLFERFVAGFLTRHWREIAGTRHAEISLQTQLGGDSAVHLARNTDGQKIFQLIPDVLLRDKTGCPVVIIDTKYKRLSPLHAALDVSQADMYQMLAYAGRLGCSQILLLYPSTAAGMMSERFTVESMGVSVDVQTVNLHQPLSDKTALINDFRALLTAYL